MKLKWRIFEEIEPIALLPVQGHMQGVVSTGKVLGGSMHYLLNAFEGRKVHIALIQPDAEKAGRQILEKIKRDPDYVKRIKRLVYSNCQELTRYTSQFKKGLSRKRNAELAEMAQGFRLRHMRLVISGYIANILDYADPAQHNILVQELEEYLDQKKAPKADAVHAISVLTTPEEETVPAKEHKAFLKLAQKVFSTKAGKKLFLLGPMPATKGLDRHPGIAKLVDAHISKWAWISFLFVGPIKWDRRHYAGLLHELLKGGKNPAMELKKLGLQPAKIRQEKRRIKKKLSLGKDKQERLFGAAADAMFSKAYRKDVMSYGWHALSFLQRECAKRLGLSIGQIEFMLITELSECLRNGKIPPKLVFELNKRRQYCYYSLENGREIIFSGEKARKLIEKLKASQGISIDNSQRQIKGHCACPGKAIGRVRIINSAHEMEKMTEGDILVSRMTNPEIVPAMKKAAAIVTNAGGLTCHAAIISRELRIPCVIGTAFATKLLKDGDKVEVDATNSVVHRL